MKKNLNENMVTALHMLTKWAIRISKECMLR